MSADIIIMKVWVLQRKGVSNEENKLYRDVITFCVVVHNTNTTLFRGPERYTWGRHSKDFLP